MKEQFIRKLVKKLFLSSATLWGLPLSLLISRLFQLKENYKYSNFILTRICLLICFFISFRHVRPMSGINFEVKVWVLGKSDVETVLRKMQLLIAPRGFPEKTWSVEITAFIIKAAVVAPLHIPWKVIRKESCSPFPPPWLEDKLRKNKWEPKAHRVLDANCIISWLPPTKFMVLLLSALCFSRLYALLHFRVFLRNSKFTGVFNVLFTTGLVGMTHIVCAPGFMIQDLLLLLSCQAMHTNQRVYFRWLRHWCHCKKGGSPGEGIGVLKRDLKTPRLFPAWLLKPLSFLHPVRSRILE